jgi:hypothetical protein
MVRATAVFLAVVVLLGPLTARAQPAPSVPLAPAPPAKASRPLPNEPSLYHVPLTTAPQHTRVAIGAVIVRPDLVKRAIVAYRHGDTVDEVDFQRSSLPDQPYIAVIPAEHVERPNIAYAVEIENTGGRRTAVFASREDMHPVEVVGDFIDAKEEALLARLGGRRFFVESSGEYAYFGKETTPATAQPVHDEFWRLEAGFTYRLLRTVSEFGIRGGAYRGTSAVAGETDPSKYRVGLNYGAPWVRLRANDWLHLEGEILTSITEVGFSLGGGGAMLLGDAYASHLTLGFESINIFGTRGYSRFDVVTNYGFRVAPTVEVTSMPHASSAGVRLLMDLGVDLGHFTVTLRGGYQARVFDSGGPAAGGAVAYAF